MDIYILRGNSRVSVVVVKNQLPGDASQTSQRSVCLEEPSDSDGKKDAAFVHICT